MNNISKLSYRILWAIALVSLAINIVVIISLANARSFTTAVNIDDAFRVPIKTTVPINATVRVPVTIPILGQVATLLVPIDTNVPIDFTIEVPIKKSISVNVPVPVDNFLYRSIMAFRNVFR